MKKVLVAGIVVMTMLSAGYSQVDGASAPKKGTMSDKVTALMAAMDGLIKESTPNKMQDAADAMEKVSEDIKDVLKKAEKGTPKEKELKGIFEDMKDMIKKLKNGSATAKDMEAIKVKMSTLQQTDKK